MDFNKSVVPDENTETELKETKMLVLERSPDIEMETETQQIVCVDFDDMMNGSQLLSKYIFFKINSMCITILHINSIYTTSVNKNLLLSHF